MTVKVIDPTQPRLLTIDEWVQHPEADQYELIDGVLRARMVNLNRHEYAVARLAQILNNYYDLPEHSGSVFGSNTKYRVRGRRGIMPDLSVLLGAKADAIDPDAAYNTVGPDLAVEVLSPDQGEDYVEERLDDFEKLGTAEVWIVNPWGRTLTGYAREAPGYVVFAQAREDEEFSSRLITGLSFAIGRLWMRRP
jgi:Uma2 family endonuclease